MSRRVVRLALGVSVALGVVCGFSTPAFCIPPFKAEFEATYVKKDSQAANDVALAAAVEKAKCAICHVGKEKKKRNPYGMEIGKLVTKADKENKEKIHNALVKVAAMKSNPKDPNSPTYGELIAQGKLPCGPKGK